MEKIPPEKSDSFASRDDDNNNNNKKQSDPDLPSSPPSSLPELLAGDSQSDSHDTSTEPTIEEAAAPAEAENPETTTEDPSISDLDSSLPKISEDIDRFLSLFESNTTPVEIPNSVDEFAKLVEAQIAKYNSDEDPIKWRQDSDADATLLEAVDRLSKLTTALSKLPSDAKYVSSINRIGSVLQSAMSYLEEEFRSILENGESEPTNLKGRQQSFNSNSDCCVISEPDSAKATNFPGYSPETVSNLNRIAAAMIAAGYETECCQVYSISRRNSFEEALKNIGFDKIGIDDVLRMQWESLEGEISNWIKVFKRSVTVYFAGEHKFCDAVFQENPSVSGSLFGNLACGVVAQLLNFVEAVAMTKRSAEKLFKFLDMYEAMRDMIPEFDNIFSGQSSEDIKTEIFSAQCRLGEAAVGIFYDLENSIKSDTSKTPVPGGAVHPLTRYTMNYLKYACEYKDTLEQIFQEHQKIDHSDVVVGGGSEKESSLPTNQADKLSPFSVQLMTVMDMLGSNLEAKSKIYRDLSLNHIFLMNNGRYIMQKIKGSKEIYELIGDPWCRKRSSDLRQYHKNYQRETWNKVLGCLKDEGLQVHGKVSKPVLKERFKAFNAMFEEIHKTQSAWIVSDEQLQSELRVSISAVVIPAYRSFLGRFRQYLDSGRQSEKYIKYGPEDIETSIDDLFEGNPTSMARRRT
ncbi:exocyst complex component EXO70B1-like [Macadamia integrifolia]|uniref:exocyst complex component EXO70B1-like n=1 Tax=Macadamia integrifolia TaxID=60698 RepID=UPI001C4E4F66|nr:exocyst complex component EXO70B1-like [Macadamia integrifolia]